MPDLEQGILSDEPPLSTSEKDDAPATQSSQAGLSYKDVSEALFKLPTYHDIGTGGHGTVNHMHTNNVAYLKTKILKHALVFNAARAEAGEGLFKPREYSLLTLEQCLEADLISSRWACPVRRVSS